jgi:hypothetical protein
MVPGTILIFFHNFLQSRLSSLLLTLESATVFDAFMLLFNHLPLAARVNHRILCVHGGIGRVQTLAQIEAIPRGLPIFGIQSF